MKTQLYLFSSLKRGFQKTGFLKTNVDHLFSVRSISTSNNTPLKPIRIVFISDTHSSHEGLGELPPGDLLIHSGDFTESRPPKPPEYKQFIDWYASQPHKNKVLISGNRDQFMDTDNSKKVISNGCYFIKHLLFLSMNVPLGSGWSKCRTM